MNKSEYTEAEIQDIFSDLDVSYERIQELKHLLPTKTYDEVSFYDQDGSPKFNVGDILVDGEGKHWLIIK